MEMDEHLVKGNYIEEGYPLLLVYNLVTKSGMRRTLRGSSCNCRPDVATDGHLGSVGGFRFGVRDKDFRLKLLHRFEGPGFEVLTNLIEPSGSVRLAVPTDVDEVLAKLLFTHVLLDSRYDLVFHFFPRTILDPTVLDDVLSF